uniref:RNA-directed RNA polymerase L n=1 Tax=Orthomarburgvirus marburgense TaxID=3052505 RepID=K4MR40_9MONO|nr:polymerase [Orthomarburgvirus marburgense]AFV31268.1 polymerase [Orthomarburgvirus marburgense]AFV31303.1 polymerase [Orthomarburgvirus marburgense]
MQHPTQYPDARLSSPIVLDQCDLLARSLGLYSHYSHNPKLRNCRIPHHIYRLRNSTALKTFLQNCSILTVPFHSIWDHILTSIQYDAINHVDDFKYLLPSELVKYANWDNEFLKTYLNKILRLDHVFPASARSQCEDFSPKENPYYWGMLLLVHLSQLARRIKGQRGSLRSNWKFIGTDLELFGIADFIIFKVPVKTIIRNAVSLQASKPGLRVWYRDQNLTPYLCDDEFIVSVASYECFIMIKDVFIERYNTWEICARAWLEDSDGADYPPLDVLGELYNYGDQIIAMYLEDGFKLIKHLEPLCVSCIQTHGIFTPRKYWFQSQMIKSYYDELCDLNLKLQISDNKAECAQNFIKTIIQAKLTPQQYCELFSLQKHWGHPVLYNDVALDKVKKHAQATKILKPKVMFETFCVFKFIVAKNHYHSQGSWYKTTHDLHLTPYLRQHIVSNSFPSQAEIYQHLWEWYFVEHEPLFSTKIISDLSIFIKDRATAVNQECWDSVFDRSVLGYNPPVRFQSKRVPEQFLGQADFSLNQILDFAEKLEYLAPSYRNFSFSLKEKELNIGRTFGKLPYRVRNVQTLAEALLADGLAKAFPSNMMVVTEREQKEALLHQASWHHNSASIGENAIVRGASFVTDLEKYNLAFRYEFTRHFINYCNRCYGVKNLFDWMHFLIPLCYMHVSDFYSPPHCVTEDNRNNPPDCANAYHYHLGGIEGLQQKLWTCISCAQITLVELKTKLKLKSSVMGDNQCITTLSLFPIDAPNDYQENEAELNAARVAVELAITTGYSGIFLKPEETFVHSGFIYFGKKQYLNGVQLPQSLKTMARCGPLSDSIFDDLQGSLASIGTSFERGTSETRHIFPSRWIASFHSMLAINLLNQNHLGFPLGFNIDISCFKKPLTFSEKLIALITPQVLGGLSFLNPEKLFYRNISDPLTSGLFQLKNALEFLGKEELFYILIAKKPGLADASDFVMNPLGLNVPGSREIITFLRQTVRENITITSQNRIINSLFHIGSDLEDQKVCEWLLSSNPVMSRFAADIFSRTPSGKRLQVLGYLEGTRTLLASRTISLTTEGTMLMKLRELTRNRWKSWFSYIDALDDDLSESLEKFTCTVDVANFLRAYSWSDILKGKRLIGATLPCLLEQFKVKWINLSEDLREQFNLSPESELTINLLPYDCKELRLGGSNDTELNYVSCALDRKVVQKHPSVKRLAWTIGNRAPYIGSRTEDKIGYPPLRVNCPSAALKEAIEMVSRLLWVTQGTADREKLLIPLLNSRVNLDYQTVLNFLPTHYSGNIVHRYNDQYGQHSFMANRMSNTSTRAIISTNTLGKYAGGGQAAIDSNIIFQNTINLGVAVLDIALSLAKLSSASNVTFRLMLNKCCTRHVPSEYLFFDKPLDVDLNKYMDNELVYDNDPLCSGIKGRLGRVSRSTLSLSLNVSDIGSYDFPTIAAWTLGETIVGSIFSDESSQSTDPISSGCTKTFVTHFLVYPVESIFYAFGANLIVESLSLSRIKSIKNLSDLTFLISSTIRNLSHRSLRILQSTFRHELVLTRLAHHIPLISLMLGGSAGEKSSSDAVRLFLTASYQNFIHNFSCLMKKGQSSLPVWLYFPSEGQQLKPILKILQRLSDLLSPDKVQRCKTLADTCCSIDSFWVYPSKSTRTNHYYASLNYWRDKANKVKNTPFSHLINCSFLELSSHTSSVSSNQHVTNSKYIFHPEEIPEINTRTKLIEYGSTALQRMDIKMPPSEQNLGENCRPSKDIRFKGNQKITKHDQRYEKKESSLQQMSPEDNMQTLACMHNSSPSQTFIKSIDVHEDFDASRVILNSKINNFNLTNCTINTNLLTTPTGTEFLDTSPLQSSRYSSNPRERSLPSREQASYLYVDCSNIPSISLDPGLRNMSDQNQIQMLINAYKRDLHACFDSNQFCRFTGVVSSMHYKLYDLLPPGELRKAICLAEGEGSGARLLLKWKETDHLFFNTLATDSQQEAEILSGRVIPRMLYNIDRLSALLESRRLILNNLTIQITDITNPLWLDSVIQYLPEDSDILTMDAETTKDETREQLYKTIVNIWTRTSPNIPKISIIKVFLLDYEGTLFLMKNAIQYYGQVQLKKPYSSNAKNSEWYLCCSKRRIQRLQIDFPDQVGIFLICKAMSRQRQAIPYWLKHIEKNYPASLHEFFLTLGFPSLESSFCHRYTIPFSEGKALFHKVQSYVRQGKQHLHSLMLDYENNSPLLDLRNHFICSLRGKITKYYNDILKLNLVIKAVEKGKNWSQLVETLPNMHSVCIVHVDHECFGCEKRLLLKLDFIRNTKIAEQKLLNRVIGYILFFPFGLFKSRSLRA